MKAKDKSMEVRYLPNQDAYKQMATEDLRRSFVADTLFQRNEVSMVYFETDRSIVGGVVPGNSLLRLVPTRQEMASDFFTERREIGFVNVGGDAIVRVDSRENTLHTNDVLYVGRGKKKIEFRSLDKKSPGALYFVSYPAHVDYPDSLVRHIEAEKVTIGSAEGANKRTINKYIHTGGVKSCQLVLGITHLDSGSIWNTMPAHTHQRRSEVYLYYGLGPDDLVVHLMGKPRETRNVIVRNRQAVFSPSWSVHSGAGTRNYSFVWAMGGENQEFSDMDAVPMQSLL
jgi:4-deoxy-L-threo-5-hexosulose-uronate ketol-isomerase